MGQGCAPNLCPEAQKSLDLQITSPVLKKCPSSNWGSLLSPSDVVPRTQM